MGDGTVEGAPGTPVLCPVTHRVVTGHLRPVTARKVFAKDYYDPYLIGS